IQRRLRTYHRRPEALSIPCQSRIVSSGHLSEDLLMLRSLVVFGIVLVAISNASADDKFTSKDGKFAAMFPKDKQPMESAKDVDHAGGKLKLTIFAAEVKKDVAFIVIWNDYPEAVAKEQPQDVLARVREGSKGPDGKVIDDKELTLGANKVPGRDYLLDK